MCCADRWRDFWSQLRGPLHMATRHHEAQRCVSAGTAKKARVMPSRCLSGTFLYVFYRNLCRRFRSTRAVYRQYFLMASPFDLLSIPAATYSACHPRMSTRRSQVFSARSCDFNWSSDFAAALRLPCRVSISNSACPHRKGWALMITLGLLPVVLCWAALHVRVEIWDARTSMADLIC